MTTDSGSAVIARQFSRSITVEFYRTVWKSRKGQWQISAGTAMPVGSAVDGGAEIAQGQLRRRLATALRTMLDVAPTPEETRALRIEQNHERFGQGVDLDAVARLPLGRRRTGVDTRPFDQSAEPRILHVDDPRAVARLNYDFIHGTSIP
jgi:hypothetical protein